MTKKVTKKEEISASPYLDGRREWNERYGNYIKQAGTWRMLAILSVVSLFLSIGGLVYIGSQSRIVPYIVSLDKVGRVVGVRKATAGRAVNTKTIKYLIGQFIKNLRTVYPDVEISKDNIFNLYRFLADNLPAKAYIDTYYRKSSPFIRMQNGKVDVTIESIIVVSKNTWQVDWQEVVYDQKGSFQERLRFRSILSVIIKEPTTEKEILSNPIGLYVKDISWTKID